MKKQSSSNKYADPNDVLQQLINAWCAREELHPLARILPSYLANNGLTDGWMELLGAISDTISLCQNVLRPEELTALREIRVLIQNGLENR